MKRLLAVVIAASAASLLAMDHPTPGVGFNNNARYATDAYPGFDSEDEILKPERKEPRWFAFINGPNRENATAQMAYCMQLEREGDYSKAAKQYDALVREWPTSAEAPRAQLAYAELLLTKLDDAEEAFKAYRYLHDFYSLNCDYDQISEKLYKVAQLLQVEGKEVMFVRFENTVDVRRAFETCVLHSPGAAWVPKAMLTIAELREKDGQFEQAVKVYENLRNLYPESDEAKLAFLKEAQVRMTLHRELEYNRSRSKDTVGFLMLALRNCRAEDTATIQALLGEVQSSLDDDAYNSAKFYDSPTRTKRSAVKAYEKYLVEYPEGKHAVWVKARLQILKGTDNVQRNKQ